MKIDIRFTIGLIIYDSERGRYLILRRNPERYRGWGLVKGGINEEETAEQACIRETFEEIGILMKESSLNELNHVSAYYDNTNKKIVLVHWFLTECGDLGRLTLEQAEWVDHRWASYDEALYELAWQSQQRALKVAHKFLTKSEVIEEEGED